MFQLVDEDESAADRRSIDTDADLEQEGTIVFQSDVSGDIGLGDEPIGLPDTGQDDGVELEELAADVRDFPTQESYA